MSNKRLLIDFDRVVHQYSKGWKDGSIYDAPVPGALEAIKTLQSQGWEIVIFTTRSTDGNIRNKKIQNWLLKFDICSHCIGLIHDINKLNFKPNQVLITNTKIPARAIIDDRAIRFTNWRDILNYFI